MFFPKLIRQIAVVALSSALIFSESCNKDDKKILSPGPVFSLDKFETELKNSMEPSGAKGWAYIISQNGLFARGKAYGKARTAADGELDFSLNKKINIASVTKFLTAIGVMQLLEERSLSINSKIAPWLPPSWARGTGVADLTFADLLLHTSGLSSTNTNFNGTLCYACLQNMIATGVTNPLKPRNYLNANFALFRIIIPSLWKGRPDAPTINPALDSITTENVYISFMQKRIFEPIGITGADCEPEPRGNCTLYYATSDNNSTAGSYYGSWQSISGGGGYFLTAMELARILAFYRHTEIILSSDQRQIMEQNRFGFNLADTARETRGTYYSKNGSISNTPGQGVLTEIVLFPNQIEVVVVFNSQGMVFAGGQTATSSAIYDAYNKSWE